MVPSEDYGGESFYASPIASDGLLTIFGIPWFIGASPSPISAFMFIRVHVCFQISPIYKNPSHIVIERPALLQDDFVLTNYISNDPFSQILLQSHSEAVGIRTSTYEFLGGQNSTDNIY